jgi:LysM domain
MPRDRTHVRRPAVSQSLTSRARHVPEVGPMSAAAQLPTTVAPSRPSRSPSARRPATAPAWHAPACGMGSDVRGVLTPAAPVSGAASCRGSDRAAARHGRVRAGDARILARRSRGAADAAQRLTRRGATALAAGTLLVAAALLSVARLSAPADPRPAVVQTPISVQRGDTLWSIAQSLAPDRDPRLVVAELERVNHLTTSLLTPGQRLRAG